MTASNPDWAALYNRHKDAMYRVAASVLRGAGLSDHAPDVVQDAIISLMANPPAGVDSWEAVMVATARRRALDRIRSAPVRHAHGGALEESQSGSQPDFADDVVERVDRQVAAANVWDALSVLDERHRRVAREYVGKGRPRADVAAELGVSPGRVSQIAKVALQQLRAELERKGVNGGE